MLTVYIADDEEVVRAGLKKIINWQELGFEICGEAGDGLSAYNEIRDLNPDLLLLDIRMPKLQGLDLAYQLREDGYTGRIIILSGYSEFKYAQDAIKCDVDFYLTKPIEEEELQKTVDHIRSIIQKKKLHNEHVKYYQEKAKYKILEDIINVEGENLATIEYSLGELNLKADLYQILILHGHDKSMSPYEALCRGLKVPTETNMIERLKVERSEVVLLKGELIIGRFFTFMHTTAEHLEPYFIAAGDVVTGINDIYYSYHKALAVYERLFFFDNDLFIAVHENLPKKDELVNQYNVDDSKEFGKLLYEHVRTYNRKALIEELEMIEGRLLYSKNSVESLKSLLAGMILYVIQEYRKDYATMKTEFPTNAEVIHHIHHQTYLHEIFNFIEGQLENMIQDISGFDSESIVDDIVEYIKHHYDKDLKLKTLAPKFGYNSSYLGKIFAKKFGSSFNDYLHQVRIEKSKELLLNAKYKVYEVSELVGYKNVDYFHLKFKNFEGCTPNDYRVEHGVE